MSRGTCLGLVPAIHCLGKDGRGAAAGSGARGCGPPRHPCRRAVLSGAEQIGSRGTVLR